MAIKPTDTLVRIKRIIGPNGIIPVSRSSFYQGVRNGTYPKPIKLGKRMSAWRLSELLRAVDCLSVTEEAETNSDVVILSEED